MMNKYPFLLFGLLLAFTSALDAQTQYEYEVSTLLPQGSNQLDDGLCLDDQGNVYGSLYGNWPGAAGTHILRYRPDGSQDTLATGLRRPNGLSYQNGYVYAANSEAGQVWKIDLSGQSSVLASLPGVSNVIPVPGTDSLIAVSWSRNTVFGINAQGDVTEISKSTLFNGLAGAAYDSAGVLYVANYNDGSVLRHDGGSDFSLFQALGGGIGFIAYADGAILATNHGTRKVYRLPISGAQPVVIAGSGQSQMLDGMGDSAAFLFPNGIVATPSGDTIYVSEYTAKGLRMITRKSVTSTDQARPTQPTIYPVPNTGMIHFENVRPTDIGSIHIYNATGKLIHSMAEPALHTGNPVRLPYLAEGTYYVAVMDRKMHPIVRQILPIVR